MKNDLKLKEFLVFYIAYRIDQILPTYSTYTYIYVRKTIESESPLINDRDISIKITISDPATHRRGNASNASRSTVTGTRASA